jgi:hypothetical protein
MSFSFDKIKDPNHQSYVSWQSVDEGFRSKVRGV